MTDPRKGEGRPGERAATQQTGETDTTLPPTTDEWRQRLAQTIAAWQARKRAERAVRESLAARRVHGLRRRHEAKLSRSGGSR